MSYMFTDEFMEDLCEKVNILKDDVQFMNPDSKDPMALIKHEIEFLEIYKLNCSDWSEEEYKEWIKIANEDLEKKSSTIKAYCMICGYH